ncbi:2TM domain-containing protein [Aquimarina hainanensis]|uniref:2TM domain-containing protein n=1 Tax=Aquimarina hainanensis TaxID=1578017 RepID=A0ABW5NDR4_9FLAO|nr:2TM domain-containing protein [Aquimarina sp. TRL1]QKX07115.1 2TM domain-containing protein [Aquimarina sp. TRL1]
MNNNDYDAYKRAKARVEKEKGFYSHLTVYIVINIVILIVNVNFRFNFDGAEDWLNWNLLVTPVLWGIGLLFHAIGVFGKFSLYGKKWEERKIKELMEEEERASKQNHY